jgi:hypothetical protein
MKELFYLSKLNMWQNTYVNMKSSRANARVNVLVWVKTPGLAYLTG